MIRINLEHDTIAISITNAFDKIVKESKRKPNKIWVDQGSKFYNGIFKKWFSDNDIIVYSTYNEGKSVVAERFIRTLKNELYKHMTARSKNVYFAKVYTPNWRKEIFIVDKINDTVPYMYNIKDLNDEEIIGSFYDKELQKTEL